MNPNLPYPYCFANLEEFTKWVQPVELLLAKDTKAPPGTKAYIVYRSVRLQEQPISETRKENVATAVLPLDYESSDLEHLVAALLSAKSDGEAGMRPYFPGWSFNDLKSPGLNSIISIPDGTGKTAALRRFLGELPGNPWN